MLQYGMSINKKIVSWEEVESYIQQLIAHVKEKGLKPSGVYGLPRAGLVYAVMVSYHMNIPLLMAPTEGCIIIDDIADSGRTLSHFTNNDTQFNKYFITTMYYHTRSIVKPDFYVAEKGDAWIVFPYEYNDPNGLS